MSSLTSYTPTLAKLVGLDGVALYERQRSLVRVGLLEPEGRGPGRGVQATPKAVALLLISALATDRLVDAAVRTRDLAAAVPKNGRCPLTGRTTFLDALTAALSIKFVPFTFDYLEVSHIRTHAALRGRANIGEPKIRSEFIGPNSPRIGRDILTVLEEETLLTIKEDVHAILRRDAR